MPRKCQLLLADFVPYRLSIASALASERIAEVYRALFGLSVPEWRIVAVVAEMQNVTQAMIGERTLMDKMTVSRATGALVNRGLIARSCNTADGRSHMLSLTPSGEHIYDAIVPQALALEAQLLSGLCAAEVEQLKSLLHRVGVAAKSM